MASVLLSLNAVEPGYIEHSKETEIGSKCWGFFISERLLRQIRSKGNKKTVRYSGDPLYPVFDITEFDSM